MERRGPDILQLIMADIAGSVEPLSVIVKKVHRKLSPHAKRFLHEEVARPTVEVFSRKINSYRYRRHQRSILRYG